MTTRRCALVAASAVLLLGASAQAAGAKTIRLFSSPTSSAAFDPNGNPMGQNQQPTAGSYFIGTDNDFKGNHVRHGKVPVATDHTLCTILDPASFTVLCDAQIAFPGGMLIADRQKVSFSTPSQVFTITAGTGRYRNAKGGTVTATSPNPNSNASDLVIRY